MAKAVNWKKRLFWVVLLAPIFYIFGKVGEGSPAERQAKTRELATWRSNFSELVKQLPPPGAMKACPKVTPAEDGPLYLIPADTAAALASEKSQSDPTWGWLAPQPLTQLAAMRDVKSVRKANDLIYGLKGMIKPGYVAVLHGTSRHAAEFKSEGKFVRWFIGGTLAVVEWKSKRPICWTHFESQNSATVKFSKRGLFSTTAQKAVLADFKKNINADLKRALTQLGLTLRPASID